MRILATGCMNMVAIGMEEWNKKRKEGVYTDWTALGWKGNPRQVKLPGQDRDSKDTKI